MQGGLISNRTSANNNCKTNLLITCYISINFISIYLTYYQQVVRSGFKDLLAFTLSEEAFIRSAISGADSKLSL